MSFLKATFAILCICTVLTAPLLTHAHGGGFALKKVVGEYTVDLHYPFAFRVGTPIWLNFFLTHTQAGNSANFDTLDLSIVRDNKTILQTTIPKKVGVATATTVTFPERGNYTLHLAFNGGGSRIAETSFTISVASDEQWVHFIKLGIHHIFTGIDHVLFLLAMMLTYLSLREAFKLTLTFTIAHSLTLILAGTLALSIGARIVEPLIAFSIAYVAITTVFFQKGMREKMSVVFLFGLVHGLGFAGLLKKIDLPSDSFLTSLIFFNIGIEIGQLIIVLALITPILWFIRRTPWQKQGIQAIAILISLIGVYWGVQRLIA